MPEIKGISDLGINKVNNRNAAKVNKTETVAFSSYLNETVDLDDIFERASKKYNVPVELLKAIAKAESDFVVDAVSRSGAQGIMQLMPGTAAELGVTDPFDPEQNIMGGSKYISDLLKRYDGDTKLALAAYNAGMGNVKKYGGIPPFEETQNYVVKVTRFMEQDFRAGTAVAGKTIAGRQGRDQTVGGRLRSAEGSLYTPYTTAPVDWHLRPSEQTSRPSSGDISDLMEALFSYQDYLRFLNLFLGYKNS